MSTQHFDVIIIGAGLSGICAAYHLQEKCPNKSYTILEGRAQIGGTWDLFRYPGVRSDSDMTTLGYKFRPWLGEQHIADGPAIKSYINATAEDNGIKENIVFSTKVLQADWSSASRKWTLKSQNSETTENITYTASFVISCCGYYNYEKGHTPHFEGLENYSGQFIHPQQWPENLAYQGKKIVVIGSGATAITLLPALAKGGAALVTMLQRSPSYYVILQRTDTSIATLSKFISEQKAYNLVRWRNINLSRLLYKICKAYPNFMKKLFIKRVRKLLPEGYDVEKHFTPNYYPWDQRVCIVPDNDFFSAIKKGQCAVATDHIDRFTEKGILLKSGETLEADIVVSATGLDLQLIGGIQLAVDGKALIPNNHYAYKSGSMVSDVPNFTAIAGYTNASWTLKADLISEYFCRLINFMDKEGYKAATPIYKGKKEFQPFLKNFSSGYITRSYDKFPSQGTKSPWLIIQDYKKDTRLLLHSKVDDGHLKFT